jgi:aspartate dehydrogenase
MHLGVIGYGTIAQMMLDALRDQGAAPARLTVLARRAVDIPGADVVHDAAALIAARPDLVVECAGHAAVRDHATATLAAGIETVIVSVGALADEALLAAVRGAARAGGARAVLPAGAVGAIDALAALRLSGLHALTYTGRKPPMAWAGSPAEAMIDLATLTEPAVIFEGTARAAALAYPKNANVAATVALAGAGFDATTVRLIADPGVTRNVHEISVTAGAADFTFRIEGNPAPANPKTSATTALSVAREVINRSREIVL